MLEKMRTVAIDEEVKDVLQRAEIEGKVVRIVQQLDRDLYVRVNKVLEALGGKWSRKDRGHVFQEEAAEKIAEALGTGRAVDIKKSFEFFPTPPAVISMMIQRAEPIEPKMKILEPSAGHGAIADAVSNYTFQAYGSAAGVDVVEIEPSNRKVLKSKGYKLVGKDFLKFKKKGYDRILMNPPFSKQQDIDHVMHAFKLLAPEGVLVAVMGAGVEFRSNKKAEKFKDLLALWNGRMELLSEGSFLESGTGVNTVLVTIRR